MEFSLCPYLIERVQKELGAGDYQEYFSFPWRMVEDIRLPGHDVEQYRKFYQRPLADGADIDTWGVGHEKSPNSMHMTYMRHPLEDAEDLEDLQKYPFPDFAHGGKCPSEGAGGCFKKTGSDSGREHADHDMGNGMVFKGGWKTCSVI